jgi:hypothetical protein
MAPGFASAARAYVNSSNSDSLLNRGSVTIGSMM